MTLKFRYKEPQDTISKLIVETLVDKHMPIESVSDNFKFAIAVTELGLLLRDSKYKGNSNYKDLITMAKKSKGKDEDGYRAEFIRLAETCELMEGAEKSKR